VEENFHIQVTKEHYYNDYDNIMRFISYLYQINIVKKVKPKEILEIGIGNKTVSNYLKFHNFSVTTCDFDNNLNPDYVADVRHLPFKNDSYELVMACEILEHIPWEDIKKVLSELHRVTKKHVVISIPYPSVSFEFIIKFPFIKRIFKKSYIDLFLRLPSSFIKDVKFHGEHNWAMGTKNHPYEKIKKTLEKQFTILEEIRPVLNSYHFFFVLEKNFY
jgi:hypothetical protein